MSPKNPAPKISPENLDDFTVAYIECALWSSSEVEGRCPVDLAPETLRRMVDDCCRFQVENRGLLEEAYLSDVPNANADYAGHDFWLTRNRHDGGFWDGDWPKEIGQKLTEAAQAFDECDLYVGDDDKIYLA